MNRAALVTGGSAGIGLAVTERLVRDGYDVTICGRDPDRLRDACAAVAAGGEVRPVEADLSRTEDVDRVVREHLAAHGRIDVLVNNAGVGLPGRIGQKPLRQFELEVNLNLRAAFHMLQLSHEALVAAGRETGKALVVNMGSVVARECPPGVSGYAATKAGLAAVSSAAHAELSSFGVQVATLVLGFVDTPGTSWVSDLDRDAMVTAADVGEAVAFLLRTSPGCFVPELVLSPARGTATSTGIAW